MAASTWFQGSAWPPGNHGLIPSRSWTAAMVPTVSAASRASRIPATSGSDTDRPFDDGLLDVDDQALADDRVERPLQQPRRTRSLHQVPDQEPVIEAWEQ